MRFIQIMLGCGGPFLGKLRRLWILACWLSKGQQAALGYVLRARVFLTEVFCPRVRWDGVRLGSDSLSAQALVVALLEKIGKVESWKVGIVIFQSQ